MDVNDALNNQKIIQERERVVLYQRLSLSRRNELTLKRYRIRKEVRMISSKHLQDD